MIDAVRELADRVTGYEEANHPFAIMSMYRDGDIIRLSVKVRGEAEPSEVVKDDIPFPADDGKQAA